MENISPKYLMSLVKKIEKVLWAEYKTYKEVRAYIEKWHEVEESWNSSWENFSIVAKDNSNDIDLWATLHKIDGETLLKIAMDLGIETPDYIPAIPTFRNEIKASYKTASSIFEKAFKQVEQHPDIAIGLANSALESIIKEILKDERVKTSLKGSETLYVLAEKVLKTFQLFPKSDMPNEIKVIGSSLLTCSKSIEELRSEKTEFHGKTKEDYIVKEPLYACFVINSIATIGLFLIKYFENKFITFPTRDDDSDFLPF
ncbi:abortive infection family protein [Butyricimonas hominis]|jgi:hypothetical protein|uniref:Abortive infection family protein n=1 Tax=Butyricimonas hominis TaxID=2763032 RepID=A0ABR7D5T9_9BACT|nr:abortive infection family protein [Butyricimonas hominis]MBC5623306.1 abortive infection family protein [Butyricimonas hominis]